MRSATVPSRSTSKERPRPRRRVSANALQLTTGQDNVRNYRRRIQETEIRYPEVFDAAGVGGHPRGGGRRARRRSDLERRIPVELARAGGAILGGLRATPASTSTSSAQSGPGHAGGQARGGSEEHSGNGPDPRS